MKILVRAPNWLGDIVMARPAIATIRGGFPEAALTVAAPPAFAPLCAAIPGVDAVLPLPRGNSPAARRAEVIEAGAFDLAILLTNSFGTALDVWRAGVPERWGFRADWRGRLLTRAIERPGRGKTRRAREPLSSSGAAPRGRHHSEYYLALTTALGMTPVRESPPVRVPDEARARARELLLKAGWDGVSPLAAVAPGAAYGYAKRWPPDRFAAVIARLAAGGVRPVLVGAAADRESARAVESALAMAATATAAFGDAAPAGPIQAGGICLNLVGATDLPALMGLFGQCAVVLSNDSGAMHLASAVGRPVVAVFGPTDDVATAPLGAHVIVRHDVWCRPCLLRECPIDHRCMRGVTPDVVFDALGAYAPFTS